MSIEKKSWDLIVEEDPKTGELILTLPPELLKRQNWKEGDDLEWTEGKNGEWFLSKGQNNSSSASSTVDRMC